ncbi:MULTISPECIES: LacI family DNA-binding transcriptional regulator [unclassified Mesorhizobium]|jgi:LacI family transcriptional regulator|nr:MULTISPECIES: LacI family DNA-binding transcriptional regulator [unclassified Mesorhizobium]
MIAICGNGYGPRSKASAVTQNNGTEKRQGRPTMTDVARIAGVSQSSVSLVLNQMTGARISQETRQRVLEAARQVNYQLPGIRREIAPASDARTIAFIVDEISTSPHPVVSFDGARDFAFEQDFLVAAYVTRSNPELEAATVEAIRRDKSIVGVIYASIFTRRVTVPPALNGIPTVLLNCYAEARRHMSILPGEVAGGFTATAHLTSLGHRRIGFINGEPWMDASVDRLKGYRQALATVDIAFDETLVRSGDWLPLTGYHHTRDLLSTDNPPTAIFCGNDLMALGALEAANEKGINVPQELSIMGYDDQELARYTHPRLSTLVLPNYEMGQRATEVLVDMVAHNKQFRPMTIKIDGPLVIRETTAPPKRTG